MIQFFKRKRKINFAKFAYGWTDMYMEKRASKDPFCIYSWDLKSTAALSGWLRLFKKQNILDLILYLISEMKCDPSKNDYHCCTKDSPCGEGEGDCEKNKGQCKDGLVCGTDNCRAMHGGDTSIYSQMDCCEKA